MIRVVRDTDLWKRLCGCSLVTQSAWLCTRPCDLGLTDWIRKVCLHVNDGLLLIWNTTVNNLIYCSLLTHSPWLIHKAIEEKALLRKKLFTVLFGIYKLSKRVKKWNAINCSDDSCWTFWKKFYCFSWIVIKILNCNNVNVTVEKIKKGKGLFLCWEFCQCLFFVLDYTGRNKWNLGQNKLYKTWLNNNNIRYRIKK